MDRNETFLFFCFVLSIGYPLVLWSLSDWKLWKHVFPSRRCLRALLHECLVSSHKPRGLPINRNLLLQLQLPDIKINRIKNWVLGSMVILFLWNPRASKGDLCMGRKDWRREIFLVSYNDKTHKLVGHRKALLSIFCRLKLEGRERDSLHFFSNTLVLSNTMLL